MSGKLLHHENVTHRKAAGIDNSKAELTDYKREEIMDLSTDVHDYNSYVGANYHHDLSTVLVCKFSDESTSNCPSEKHKGSNRFYRSLFAHQIELVGNTIKVRCVGFKLYVLSLSQRINIINCCAGCLYWAIFPFSTSTRLALPRVFVRNLSKERYTHEKAFAKGDLDHH